MIRVNFLVAIACLFFMVSAQATTLIGTWRLSSFKISNTSKNSFQCNSPTGLLTYTASGYVAVGFNCMKRQNSNQPNFTLEGMTFYTGKYKVEGSNIIHFTENGSSPAYYKKTLVRHIDLLTDKKFVFSLDENGNHFVVGWDRVG